MATVYLAEDLKHHRKVAVKVLRPELAAVIGAERFLHEITTTANLQHPHILSLHDSGQVDGTVFYVMPFVEGESLRDRLARDKQLPIEEAVRIAREVADALGYAHSHGVIHRDIKPENILLQGGHALVADFGIALAASSAGGARMTETGMSLGTPTYMSPEQAMGERTLDARTDVYALGCVLYEMLSGDAPFLGSTAQAIVAKVLTEKPAPLSTVRETVPPQVEAAVLTALAKLPADRFASAPEFAAALGNTSFTRAGIASSATAGGERSGRRALVAVGLVAVVATAAAIWQWRQPRAEISAARFELVVPESLLGRLSFAVTPDGGKIILASKGRLWIRAVGAIGLTAIPGVEGARQPFASPDGNEVGYLLRNTINVSPLAGGPARTLADSAILPSWGSDGKIYYSTGRELRRVAATGGAPEKLYAAGAGAYIQCVELLPGGRNVLFTELKDQTSGDIRVLDLGTHSARTIERGWCARYAAPGHVVIGRENFLVAARLDAAKPAVTSTPVSLADGVEAAPFALGGGTLVYPQAVSASEMPVVVDREGRMRLLQNLPPNLRFSYARVSPDGRRVAFRVVDATGVTNIWVYTLPAGPLTRLTFAGKDLDDPNWTPDGTRVSFGAVRDGARSLYLQRADGGAEPEVLLRQKSPLWTSQWLPEGKRFVFSMGEDIIALGMGKLGEPDSARMLLASSASQRHPTLSPDGKYLAYDSNESGRTEVYIRAVEGPGQWQVSSAGGYEPRWSRKGGEIFFRNADSLYAAKVETREGVVVRGTGALFSTRVLPPYWYDVFPADTAFLMIRSGEVLGAHPPIVGLNFLQGLERRAPR
jgi:serine/threonine-protein kinase